jgi:hypothetical protein
MSIPTDFFLKKLILFNKYLKLTAPKNILHQVAPLVAPVPLTRQNNKVAPHALARKDTTHSTVFSMWKSLSRYSRWHDIIVLSCHWEWRDKTELLKNIF